MGKLYCVRNAVGTQIVYISIRIRERINELLAV